MDCGLARIDPSKSDAGLAHAPRRRATRWTIRGIQHSVRGHPRLYSDPWPSVTIRSVHVFGHKSAIDGRLQATLPGISPTASPPGDLVYRLKPMAILTALRSPEGIDAMVLGLEGEEIRVTLDALLPVLEDRTVGEFEVPVARSR